MTAKREQTTVKLPADVDLKAIVTAMLGTPPPPAGDASNRKKAPKMRPKAERKDK